MEEINVKKYPKKFLENNAKNFFQVKPSKNDTSNYMANICKIEVYPSNKDSYNILKDYRYYAWKASQIAVNELFFINKKIYKEIDNNLKNDEGYQELLKSSKENRSLLTFIKKKNEDKKQIETVEKDLKRIQKVIQKIKKDEYSKLEKSCVKEFSNGDIEDEKCTIGNYIYYMVSKEVGDKIPAGGIMNGAIKDAKSKIQPYLKDIGSGNRSVPSFNREKQNLYFQSKETWLAIMNDDKYAMRPSFNNADLFYFKLSKKDDYNKAIVDRIFSGEYIMGDSYLKFYKNKLFLYFVYKSPIKDNNLDMNIKGGVDIGIATPAYCGNNVDLQRKEIGNGKEIIAERKKLFNAKKNMQKQSELNKGGHGRKRKTEKVIKIKKRESNFFETEDHRISNCIIKHYLKINAGIIKLEYLGGFLEDSEENIKSKYLRDWTFASLQEKIEYKAIREGMRVQYVDPYHTSKECNVCGQIGLRTNCEEDKNGNYMPKKTGRKFICQNPECKIYGKIINADYNASVNIAKSNNIIYEVEPGKKRPKKEILQKKCMYHILKKEENKKKKQKNTKKLPDNTSGGASLLSNSQDKASNGINACRNESPNVRLF